MTDVPRCAVAILAAGRGSRFGGDAAKPLVEWCGRPLVQWAVDAACASALDPVVVVLGYRADDVRAALPRDTSLTVVENPGWEEGIASSLRTALGVLSARSDVDAVCVGLADQPRVGVEAYRRLAAAPADAEIVVATYDGRPGNPVRLARSLWPLADALRGDVGARQLMADHPVLRIECGDTGSPVDVDTPDDLRSINEDVAT